MTDPSHFSSTWDSAFTRFQNKSADNKDDSLNPRAKEFQLFGQSPTFQATSLTYELASPSLSSLQACASPFIPSSVTHSPQLFNPFEEHTQAYDDTQLSDHLLSTHLLDEMNAEQEPALQSDDNNNYPWPLNGRTAWYSSSPAHPTDQSLKHIWKADVQEEPADQQKQKQKQKQQPSKTESNNDPQTTTFNTHEEEYMRYSRCWDRFEPYSHEDESDFDPTLQFYRGELLDHDTIQDMNLLSLSVTNPSEEETQADNVGEDMSPIQMMESIFTDLSKDELDQVLAKHDYDVDRAMEYLIHRNTTEVEMPPPLPVPADTVVKKRQVCRHYLAGECYRKDCWFAHDLQVKVCKFWLQGSCLKGDSCEFSHYIDVQEVATKITKETKPEIKFNGNDYPELSSRPTKKSSPQVAVSSQEEFPSLTSAAKMRSARPAAKIINFAEAAKKKASSNTSANKKSLKSVQTNAISKQRLRQPVRIPWLETGSALNATYLEQRKQAIEYGMLRNRFFSRATEFYLNGDGAKAKAYSLKAKHYNRLMQEMHTEASRRIFEQRNQSEAFVDLHGLHVDEALDILEERLDKLKGYQGTIYIVTGTGHHSGSTGLSKKQSKLKPNVEQYLKDRNVVFAETSVVGDKRGGVFAVDLSR